VEFDFNPPIASRTLRHSILFFFLLLPSVLEAQAPTGGEVADTIPDPFRLEGILVDVTRARLELTRTPQSVSRLGESEIQLGQRTVTIDESLRRVPGVFATNRHNYTLGEGVRLSIRAPQARIGTRGLQLLQDGIPLTTADGTTLPNNLDLGSAGRIEVIRGPSSVLYGNSAGGVVSVDTKMPSERPLVLQPEIQLGSDGYERQQLRLEGTAGAVGYVVNLNRMETDGFRRYGGAEIRRLNVVTRTVLTERTLLRGIFNLYDMPFAENPSSLTEEDARNDPLGVRQVAIDQGWGKSVTQGQGGVELDHGLATGDRIRVLGWGVWRENWNPVPGRIIDLGRTAAGVRSEYQGSGTFGDTPFDWTAGFDLSYQRDDRREFRNLGLDPGGVGRAREGDLLIDQLETVMSVGPFVQATFRPRPDFGVTGGVRWDRYHFEATDHFLEDGDQSGDRRLSAASPMIGLTWMPRPSLNLFANYSFAYQTPTTVELSNRPEGAGGFNQELEAESIRSFEVGLRGTIPDWRIGYELAGYLSTVENGLLRYEGSDEQVFFRNAGETSRDGLEAAVRWDPRSDLEVRLAYTYQDFVFVRFEDRGTDFSGNREPGAPPHTLFAGVTHRAPAGLTSGVDLRWFDSYPVNDSNTASNWSHMIVDARFALDVEWRGGALRPFFGIDNAFDERYNASAMLNAIAARYYEPAPGRTFYVGLSVQGGR